MTLTETLKNALGIKEQHGQMTMHGERILGRAKQTGEVVGTACLLAYLNGRSPTAGKDHLQIANAPLDLGYGVLVHGAALLGFGGRYGEDAHNSADGALACYGVRLFTRYGSEARISSLGGGAAAKQQMASGGWESRPHEQTVAGQYRMAG